MSHKTGDIEIRLTSSSSLQQSFVSTVNAVRVVNTVLMSADCEAKGVRERPVIIF